MYYKTFSMLLLTGQILGTAAYNNQLENVMFYTQMVKYDTVGLINRKMTCSTHIGYKNKL